VNGDKCPNGFHDPEISVLRHKKRRSFISLELKST
jgi:hypothetical protein